MIKSIMKFYFKFKKPLINVLIRTSNRPNYFESCYQSIVNQTYKNIRIIVSYDNEQSFSYLKNYKNCTKIKVNYPNLDRFPEPDVSRGEQINMFPANLYLNELMAHVEKGYIIYLDDDDIFTKETSIETIVNNISSINELLFWRVKFPAKLIPEDNYFEKPPILRHISGIGFAFHYSYVSHAQWDGWKGSDWAVATKLYNVVPDKVYINIPLTGLQRVSGHGDRLDKELMNINESIATKY